MKNDIVRVVFAVDSEFVSVLAVAIASLSSFVDRDREYEIVIMQYDLTQYDRDKLEHIVLNNENISISFVDPPNIFESALVGETLHFSSKATFFRLSIPMVFQDWDRLVYADCDVIFCDDVAKIFDHTFSDNAEIAAVPAIGITQSANRGREIKFDGEKIGLDKYIVDTLGILDFSKYFNAGIAVLSLSAIRNSDRNYADELNIIINQKFHMSDQDMWNILFKDRLDILDVSWNFQNPSNSYVDLGEDLLSQIKDAREHPNIIHFTTGKKPWNSVGVSLGGLFWENAKKTPYHAELLERFGDAAFSDLTVPNDSVAESAMRSAEVSIVIPVFDMSTWLAPALASALNQTVRAEIIIVDDYSTDASLALAEYVCNKFERCKLVRHETRRYSGAARNTGLKVASGNYVAFMDPDDLYASDIVLEELLEQIEASDADAAFGQQMTLRPNGHVVPKTQRENPVTTGKVEYDSCTALWAPLHHHRFLFKTEYLLNHGLCYPDYKRGQDVVFLAKFLASQPQLASWAYPAYLHRVRSERRQPTLEEVSDLFSSFYDVCSTLSNAGKGLQAWIFLSSRFEMLLKDLHSLKDEDDFVEVVEKFILLKEFSKHAFSFLSSEYYSKYPVKIQLPYALTILNTSSNVLARIFESSEEFPFSIQSGGDMSSHFDMLTQCEKEDLFSKIVLKQSRKIKKLEKDNKNLKDLMEADKKKKIDLKNSKPKNKFFLKGGLKRLLSLSGNLFLPKAKMSK